MIFKIQIEPIISTESKTIGLFKNGPIIQAVPFKLGFKITNITKEPIRGFILKNILFKSAEGQDIEHRINKSFHIDTLNPSAKTEIWVDRFGTYMHGLAQIWMDVVPDSATDTIKTYQKDLFTEEVTESGSLNHWLDFLYVMSSMENIQNRNNSLMLFFTTLMTLIIIFNFYFFYKFQISPIINEQKKNEYEAIIHCEDNPDGVWSKAAGGEFKCSEVLEILKNN